MRSSSARPWRSFVVRRSSPTTTPPACSIEGRCIDGRGASRANATGTVEAKRNRYDPPEGRRQFHVTGPLETVANAGGVHLARAILAEFAQNVAKLMAAQDGGVEMPGEARRSAVARSCRTRVSWARDKFSGKETKWRNQLSDILAQPSAAEVSIPFFTLMAMPTCTVRRWPTTRSRLIHARHEHCCVAWPTPYARADRQSRGRVAPASRLHPDHDRAGMAARGNAPVCRVRRRPRRSALLVHPVDRQASAAAGDGRHFVPIRRRPGGSIAARAFYVAVRSGKPVVLSVP